MELQDHYVLTLDRHEMIALLAMLPLTAPQANSEPQIDGFLTLFGRVCDRLGFVGAHDIPDEVRPLIKNAAHLFLSRKAELTGVTLQELLDDIKAEEEEEL